MQLPASHYDIGCHINTDISLFHYCFEFTHTAVGGTSSEKCRRIWAGISPLLTMQLLFLASRQPIITTRSKTPNGLAFIINRTLKPLRCFQPLSPFRYFISCRRSKWARWVAFIAYFFRWLHTHRFRDESAASAADSGLKSLRSAAAIAHAWPPPRARYWYAHSCRLIGRVYDLMTTFERLHISVILFDAFSADWRCPASAPLLRCDRFSLLLGTAKGNEG